MTKIGKIFCVLLCVSVFVRSVIIFPRAVDVNDSKEQPEEVLYQETGESSAPIARVSAYFNISLNGEGLAVTDTSFFLEVGDTVSFNASYSPDFANLDYGVIAPDGRFYYTTSTNGSMDKSIRVSQHGEYTLAIRNNSPFTVRATGYVKY